MNNFSKQFTRRNFIAGTTSLAALYAAGKFAPASALAQSLPDDLRISKQPIVDKGFALVRKVGNGAYATISDRAKGGQTRCNGGFIVGRDSALVIEGFQTPIGAAFQMDTLRSVTKVPVQAAINTHYHFDHTMGNSFYGSVGVPIWAHAKSAARMAETYPKWQGEDIETFLAPWEKRAKEAKTDAQRAHAESDIEGVKGMFVPVNQAIIALPNHPLDPAKFPVKIDLGGVNVVIEAYVGHTDTDMIIRVPDQKHRVHRRPARQRAISNQHQWISEAVARDARQVRDLR